jgi:predicted nucleotidyltransferase
MPEIQEILKAHGFPYPNTLIMAFIGGSTQHGASIAESSDTDWYGIFIPPKEKTLGIDSFEHFVFPGDVSHRTRANRNTDELDIALHSLQKWAGMAAKGNPTVLSFLFANYVFPEPLPCWNCKQIFAKHPATCVAYVPIPYKKQFWMHVLKHRDVFLCKSHYKPFIYYAQDQMERLMGLRGQKNINRDKLVDEFGYDTKYAMHIIRLLSEAKELMTDGTITYPRPEVELLKDIRRGKYKLLDIRQMGEQLNAEIITAAEHSSLPDSIDRGKISSLIADIHLEFYA